MSNPFLPPFFRNRATYLDGLSGLERVERLERYIDRELIPNMESAVTTITEGSIELQDPVVEGIISDEASATRLVTDSLYADKSVQTVITNGRLGETELAETIETVSSDVAISQANLQVTTPGTDANDYLQASYNKPWANTITVFGHSIIEATEPVITTGPPRSTFYGTGFFTWIQILLNQRFARVEYEGHGGNSVAQLKARVPDVIAHNTRYVLGLFTINSINGGASAASIISDLDIILTQLTGAGKTVIVGTELPSTMLDNDAKRLIWVEVNRWIVSQAGRPGIIILPWHHALTDWGSGDPITNSTWDGTHPYTYGAMLLAEYAAAILDPLIPSIGDGDMLAHNRTGIGTALANGMMYESGGGSITGSGVGTGDVANSWTVQVDSGANADCSIIARADGHGMWQEIEINDGAGSSAGAVHLKQYNGSIDGSWANQTVIFDFDIEVENGQNLTALIADVIFIDGGSYVKLGTTLTPTSGADTTHKSFKGIVRTPPVVVPAGTDAMSAEIHLDGKSGAFITTVRIGRARVHKA